MTDIVAIDFSSGDFRNYNEADFIPLDANSIGPNDFTLNSLPEALVNAKTLLCKISSPYPGFRGVFLYDKVIDSSNNFSYKFTKKDQKYFCLLEITKDGKNVFPPYGIGQSPSSTVWFVSLTPPLIYDDSQMGGTVTIKRLSGTYEISTFNCANPPQNTDYVTYLLND